MADSLLNAEATSAENPSRTPDQAQRDAALNIRRSCIVEAPAGSGKTGLLVQRFLKLLGSADIERPDQVLAITFARDATSEIRNRINEALESARSKQPEDASDPYERQTLELARAVLARSEQLQWHLLDRPQSIHVRSIDAVCADIVGHLPVLSLAGSRLSPVEDPSPLYREAALRLLQSLGDIDPTKSAPGELAKALEALLRHRDSNLADCQALIAEMLQWRDQWGRLVPLDGDLTDERLESEVKPRLELTLQHAICKTLEQAKSAFPAEDLHELALLTHGAAKVIEAQDKPSRIRAWLKREHAPGCTHDELEAWRALAHQLLTDQAWRKPGGVNKTLGYPENNAAKAAKQALLSRLSENEPLRQALVAVNSLPDAIYPESQWAVAKSLFHLLKWSIVELKLLFAETGQCDFAEVSLAAQLALQQSSGLDDLATSMGTRLRHLLVDEMQDTSVSQYGLLRALTASWDGHSQTVFLVGDPKQSIYLFRQARVELFEQTAMRGLGNIHLDRLILTANFRSQAALVEQFNLDFAQVFSVEAGAEIGYTDAHAVRSRSGDGLAWHVASYPGKAMSPEAAQGRKQAMQQEAEDIVRLLALHSARGDGAGPRPRIAVLVRARTHLHLLAAELRKHGGIPFRAVEIESLQDQQEVVDLLSLTRALLHPSDRAAWLSILRAPWCGLTLGDLQVLTGGDDPAKRYFPMPQLIEQNAAALSSDGRARLARFWRTMQAAESQRGRLPLSQWVERTWNSLGGPACIGPQGTSANAQNYLRLLAKCEDEGGLIDAAVLATQIEKLYATPQGEGQHAVELLTMHRAKGLEWDLVVVPGLERIPGRSKSMMLSWMEFPNDDPAAETLSMLVPVAAKGEENARLNDWLNGLRNQRQLAEYKRLYYVACTRAREELHLFASASRGDKGWSRHPHSLLATAWSVAEPHFVRKLEEEAAAETHATFAAGNLQQMPQKDAADTEGTGLLDSIAAQAEPPIAATVAAPLLRLPLGYDPTRTSSPTFKPLMQGRAATPSSIQSASMLSQIAARPEGSQAARALGNTVHAFLERLAAHFAAGGLVADARALPLEWMPRITAHLRAQGLSPSQIEQSAATAIAALSNTLDDPRGLWILASHKDATAETALQGWMRDAASQDDAQESGETDATRDSFSIRLDRVFRAGAVPLASANETEARFWIVDYKTTAHGETGMEEFLEGQKEIYRAKMETYASALRLIHGDDALVNLALYYPLLKRLAWWRG